MIRVATVEDLSRLREMGFRFATESEYKDVFKANPDKIEQTVRAVIEFHDGVVIVNEDEHGELNGMIGLMAYDHPYSGERTAFELFWYVVPEARSGGSGLRLLKAAEEWAVDNGALVIQMVAPNLDIGRLYRRLNYSPVEVSFHKRLKE